MSLKAEFRRLRWQLTPERKKQKLLEDACALLRFWPETAGLLDLAKQQGVGIRFDETLSDTETDGYFHRNRTTGECFIALKASTEPRDIAIPLIHELRHLWQDKELGLTPATSGLGEPDARTALILTRVKEADAFAFTNLMISRINHAQQDFIEAQKLEQKLLQESGLTALSPLQQEQIDDFLAQKISSRIDAEKNKIAAAFLRELDTLDSYDRIALSEYHRRYIADAYPPLAHLTEKDGHVITLSDIRRLLKAGTMEMMPLYVDDSGDSAFAKTVLSGVRPAVIETVDLVDAFEKAAARGLSAAQAQQSKAGIKLQLQKALQK